MRPFHRDIPAFLSIDVEPDGFQYPNLGWTGFESLPGLVARVRGELADLSGVTPRFGWNLRMDPQVAEAHGRPDYLAVAYADVLARLEREGDVFGSHIHPLRWSADRQCWVHDFADDDWTEHCIESSFDAFAKAFGDPPARHRYGGSGLDNCVVAALDEHGVRLDLTLEPGSPPGPLTATKDVQSGIDAAPKTAPMPNCRGVPRRPYRPSRADFRRVGDGDARRLILLPLSSTRLRYGKPWWRQAGGTVKRGSRPLPRVLWMSTWRGAPKRFWDLAARHLGASPRPYLSLAIRTDAPGSGDAMRVRALLEYLPRHPLARRLRFVDPLDAVPDLLTT